MPDRFEDLRLRQEQFVQTRDWEHYHRPKNLAMALSVEAAELVELYQWQDGDPADAIQEETNLRDRTRDELADVLIYSMSMATQFDIDLLDAVEEKLEENQDRFDPEDVFAESLE